MSEPVWIEDDLVLAIHDRLLIEHGGADGVTDESLLQSALARPLNHTAHASSDIIELAAKYAYMKFMLADGDARAVPVALRTVTEAVAALKSPAWHGDVLRETDERCKAGQEQPVDWTVAKQKLRE